MSASVVSIAKCLAAYFVARDDVRKVYSLIEEEMKETQSRQQQWVLQGMPLAELPLLRLERSNEAYLSSFFSAFFSSLFAVFLPNRACVEIAVGLLEQECGPAVKGVPFRPRLQL